MARGKIDIVAKYFKEEGFLDRSGTDAVGELCRLRGRSKEEWLNPMVRLNFDGLEGQREFYDAMAEVVGNAPVYDWLKSRHYSGVKWSTDKIVDSGLLKKGASVLDVGCGTGLESCFFGTIVGDSGRVVGVDIAARALDYATKRAKRRGLNNTSFELRDRDDLQFPEGSFDTIFCIHSLREGENAMDFRGEAFSNMMAAARLRFMRALLKAGGKICLVEPTDEKIVDYDLSRTAGRLERAGYTIKEIEAKCFVVQADKHEYGHIFAVGEKN